MGGPEVQMQRSLANTRFRGSTELRLAELQLDRRGPGGAGPVRCTSLICPVPVPSALFVVQGSIRLRAAAPRELASPQATITSSGLNFGLEAVGDQQRWLRTLSLANGPLRAGQAVIGEHDQHRDPHRGSISLSGQGTLPDPHRRSQMPSGGSARFETGDDVSAAIGGGESMSATESLTYEEACDAASLAGARALQHRRGRLRQAPARQARDGLGGLARQPSGA